MQWKKAPPELVEFIAEKMKNVKCDYRKMFGYPAYFINGNMFAGLFADKLFLKLSDSDAAELMKKHKDVAALEPMPGRPMKGYVTLPKSVYSNGVEFTGLLGKSVNYVSSLPPKRKK